MTLQVKNYAWAYVPKINGCQFLTLSSVQACASDHLSACVYDRPKKTWKLWPEAGVRFLLCNIFCVKSAHINRCGWYMRVEDKMTARFPSRFACAQKIVLAWGQTDVVAIHVAAIIVIMIIIMMTLASPSGLQILDFKWHLLFTQRVLYCLSKSPLCIS